MSANAVRRNAFGSGRWMSGLGKTSGVSFIYPEQVTLSTRPVQELSRIVECELQFRSD